MKRVRVGGWEQDAFSRFGKRYMGWGPGVRKAIKRKANRRERRNIRRDLERNHDTQA